MTYICKRCDVVVASDNADDAIVMPTLCNPCITDPEALAEYRRYRAMSA